MSAPDAAVHLAPPSSLPFVGRTREIARLDAALGKAASGQGSAWLLEGPGGIGKTRLARWAEERALRQGFKVLWGYGLRESLSAFFAFEQVFRKDDRGSAPEAAPLLRPGELGPVTILADARGQLLSKDLAELSRTLPGLLLTRERPSAVRQRMPDLPANLELRWLARAEGEEVQAPAQLDALAERLTQFLRDHPGGVVAIGNLEYLVSQNSFLPVLRLVQFLRDIAESTGGHLVVSLTRAAMEPKERSLLESEGEVRELAPAPSTADVAPRAPSASPSMTLMRYLDRLEVETKERPHLIILDDLQWFDDASLQAFQFLSRNGRSLPLMFLATRRDDEGRPRADAPGAVGLDDVLDHMETEGLLNRLPLRGLTPEETWGLLEASVGGPLEAGGPGEVKERILERTGGNPFFALATAQMLVEEGRVEAHGSRRALSLPSSGSLSLPTTVRRAVERRVQRLPKTDREVLAAGAMCGREFELPPISAALPVELPVLSTVVKGLHQAHRILQPAETAAHWSFSQPVIREVAQEGIEPERSRAIALGLARWWGTERPQEVDTLARLAHLARDASGGIPWIRRAIDRAVEGQSGEGVVRLHQWLQDLLELEGGPLSGRVEEGLELVERIQRTQAAPEAAVQILRDLEARRPPVPLRWQVEAALAGVLGSLDMEEGERRLQRLEGEIAGGKATLPSEFRARLDLTRARLRLVQGDIPGARVASEQALAALGEAGDPWERCNALYYRGWALKEENRIAEATEALERARALSAPLQAPPLQVLCFSLEFSLALQQGDLRKAEAAIERAVALGRQGGPVENLVVGLTNLAATLAPRGEGVRARAALAEARKLAQRFEMAGSLAEVDQREGDLWLREGDGARAEPLLVSALTAYREMGLPELLLPCLLSLSEAHLAVGNLTGAEEVLAEATTSEESLQLSERPRLWRVRARVQQARGRPEARASLERSLALAEETGNVLEQAESLAQLAELERGQGVPTLAEAYSDRAAKLFERCGAVGPTTRAPPTG